MDNSLEPVTSSDMIFARRAIQARLTKLRPTIGAPAVDGLVKRLNTVGADRMAAMWEVLVLHALGTCGDLRHEVPLASGRQPDIEFDNGTLRFTADITCVSDDGLDDNNPYTRLSEEIRDMLIRMGMPGGGVHLRVKSTRTTNRRGSKTVLRLPPKARLRAFVQNRIEPELKRQRRAEAPLLKISIDDQEAGLDLMVNTLNTQSSSGGHAAYDIPGMKDSNPLFSALKAKARQLRAAEGLTGIIVCDGDCRALSNHYQARDGFSTEAIIHEFFRQHSSVHFVLLLTIHEEARPRMAAARPERKILGRLLCSDSAHSREEINALCRQLMKAFPKPRISATNGALRAREKELDIGHHGGFSMSGKIIRVSLREMTEVLAGLRTFADDGAKYVRAARRFPNAVENHIQLIIQHKLSEGRLPVAMKIIEGDEDDNDDWVEIEFGNPDPAITSFS